jgi:hypothetical protein
MTYRGFVDVCFLGVDQEERIYYEKTNLCSGKIDDGTQTRRME